MALHENAAKHRPRTRALMAFSHGTRHDVAFIENLTVKLPSPDTAHMPRSTRASPTRSHQNRIASTTTTLSAIECRRPCPSRRPARQSHVKQQVRGGPPNDVTQPPHCTALACTHSETFVRQAMCTTYYGLELWPATLSCHVLHTTPRHSRSDIGLSDHSRPIFTWCARQNTALGRQRIARPSKHQN